MQLQACTVNKDGIYTRRVARTGSFDLFAKDLFNKLTFEPVSKSERMDLEVLAINKCLVKRRPIDGTVERLHQSETDYRRSDMFLMHPSHVRILT